MWGQQQEYGITLVKTSADAAAMMTMSDVSSRRTWHLS
jgi:hypothetical protein